MIKQIIRMNVKPTITFMKIYDRNLTLNDTNNNYKMYLSDFIFKLLTKTTFSHLERDYVAS